VRTFAGVRALEAAIGEHLGYSDWQTLDQDAINRFAAATGDHQWIHVDANRAASGPFGATVAHGFLTLSLVPQLTWQVYRVDGVSMSVNYGADRLRFPSPVPVGSRVRAGVELTKVSPASSGYQVESRVTIERDGAPKPACVVDMITLVVP
jgi:acyl dehydratase